YLIITPTHRWLPSVVATSKSRTSRKRVAPANYLQTKSNKYFRLSACFQLNKYTSIIIESSQAFMASLPDDHGTYLEMGATRDLNDNFMAKENLKLLIILTHTTKNIEGDLI
uniref:Uncharacterized protein n=1 Tax=Glossina palpalis gambiensis TaxID=67801 RepID=A0A1B0BUD1_9MUSC